MPIPTPHINAPAGAFADTVLNVRGVQGYTGTWKGKRVSVMASGMGASSIGIYSYELFAFYDVKNIIRIGSAGAMNEKVKVRDLVIGMSAYNKSSYLKNFGFSGDNAPCADYGLLSKAVETAKTMNIPAHCGPLFTSEVFYDGGIDMPVLQKLGVLAVEMEAAALYMNAALTGKSALAICTISDHLITGEAVRSPASTSARDPMEPGCRRAVPFFPLLIRFSGRHGLFWTFARFTRRPDNLRTHDLPAKRVRKRFGIEAIRQAKPFGTGGRDISKGAPDAEVHTLRHARRVCQDRDILPGVVGGDIAGIAAVICRNDHQIAGMHEIHHFLQQEVESLQRAGKTLRVVPVAVDGIGVHEVCEAETVEILLHKVDQRIHAGRVAGSVIDFCEPFMGKNVLDLADADGFQPGLHDGLRQRASAGGHGKIAPAARALESARLADKGTGNHAPNAQIPLEHLPGNATELVQLLNREQFLMAGNLENAVAAGVNNRRMIPHVLRAQLLQDDGAGSGLVADTLVPDRLFIGIHEFLRETVREGRECAGDPHAGDFPVAGSGVLSLAGLPSPPPGAGYRPVPAVSGCLNIAKAHSRHVGQVRMSGSDDMSQGIGTGISVFRGVRRFPRADSIQYCQKNTTHFYLSFSIFSLPSGKL